MTSELYLCISQEEVEIPYKFKTTNINVYSLEEASYQCYKNWKYSYDEFLSKEFLDWVRDVLRLPFYVNQIILIRDKKTVAERLLTFLSLFANFDDNILNNLRQEINLWEERLEWERIKENADYLCEIGEAGKAVFLYRKALEYGDNEKILNNLGISFMKISRFKEAVPVLEKALSMNTENIDIMIALAEAYIYNQDFEKALKIIRVIEKKDSKNPDIQYLYGELNFETKNIRYSLEYFKKAISTTYKEHYIFRLADVYIKLRQYDNAVETLELLKDKGKKYLIKKASVYEEVNNIPAAIKSVEKALISSRNDVELWIMLAKYHRLDYDLIKAESAISKALSLDESNEKAKLEAAKINKNQGKIKDYRKILKNLLVKFKEDYRRTLEN